MSSSEGLQPAVVWTDEEGTYVRLFDTDEEAVEWAGSNLPDGSWRYATVVA